MQNIFQIVSIFNRDIAIYWILLAILGHTLGRPDVSHLFPHEFGFFPQHSQHHHAIIGQHPFQLALQPAAPPSLASLYGSPGPGSHPNPGVPPSVTPSPVAPTTRPSPTTEFSLPEIIENRSLLRHQSGTHNGHAHFFIPLSSQYLPPPPGGERPPNYESPKPSDPDEPLAVGYHYPKPTAPSTTTTTTTTTERPRPIIVADPFDPLPPINFQPSHPGEFGPPGNGGYDYHTPRPPFLPLRPSTPAPVYLPPSALSSGVLSGPSEDIVVFEAPSEGPGGLPPLRLRVHDMRCLQPAVKNGHSTGAGYFRAALNVNSFLGAEPLIERNTEDDNLNSGHCQARFSHNHILLDIPADHFEACGVRSCGTPTVQGENFGRDLCVRLRFPAIRGLRTSADAIVTLHCQTQERVAIKTHALKVGVANDVQSRSLGTYARGGTQNPLRTHVVLLRKSNRGYERILESEDGGGKVVQLGEELLLRAHVQPGDGWNYTRLSDVSLQRLSPAGEILQTAQLVTGQGCLNPAMHSVCQQPPIFESPLGYRLGLRAVLFQGMRSGEEMVLSLRITGCLDEIDCAIGVEGHCEGNSEAVERHRRDTSSSSANEKVNHVMELNRNDGAVSEISRIAFRVIMPISKILDNTTESSRLVDQDDLIFDEILPESTTTSTPGYTMEPHRAIVLAGTVAFVFLLLCIGIIAMWEFRRH